MHISVIIARPPTVAVGSVSFFGSYLKVRAAAPAATMKHDGKQVGATRRGFHSRGRQRRFRAVGCNEYRMGGGHAHAHKHSTRTRREERTMGSNTNSSRRCWRITQAPHGEWDIHGLPSAAATVIKKPSTSPLPSRTTPQRVRMPKRRRVAGRWQSSGGVGSRPVTKSLGAPHKLKARLGRVLCPHDREASRPVPSARSLRAGSHLLRRARSA